MSRHFLLLAFIVLSVMSVVSGQSPTAVCVGDTRVNPIYVDTTNVTLGYTRVGMSLFLRELAADAGDFDVGHFKNTLINGLYNSNPQFAPVTCQDVHIEEVNINLGDGVIWGTDVVFFITTNLTRAEALRKALNQSLYEATWAPSNAGYLFPPSVSGGGAVIVQYADNDKVDCVHEGYTSCDYCKSSHQTLSLKVVSPAENGGYCPPLTQNVICDGRCLKDWQIGLIALACFLFVVLILILIYCCCIRNRRSNNKPPKALDGAPAAVDVNKDKSEPEGIELEKAIEPANKDVEKPLELEIVDPQPTTNTASPSQPEAATATTDEDEPKGFSTVPDEDETATSSPAAAAPAPTEAAPQPKANVVRVHL